MCEGDLLAKVTTATDGSLCPGGGDSKSSHSWRPWPGWPELPFLPLRFLGPLSHLWPSGWVFPKHWKWPLLPFFSPVPHSIQGASP